MVDRAAGQFAGEVVLNELDRDNQACNFGILLCGDSDRGRGLGTEATRLILAHAFESVGLHRVDLEVYQFNPRARRVYEKVGFIYEGIRRAALLWDGEWIDAHVMSILARPQSGPNIAGIPRPSRPGHSDAVPSPPSVIIRATPSTKAAPAGTRPGPNVHASPAPAVNARFCRAGRCNLGWGR